MEAVTSRTITIQSVDPEIRTGGLLIEALMEYHYYEMRVAASTDKGFGNYSAPLTVLTDEHGKCVRFMIMVCGLFIWNIKLPSI